MKYWYNKLRFLFTGKLRLWSVQENCGRGYADCGDCSGSLYHWTADFLTLEEALDCARDMARQRVDDDRDAEVETNDDDPKHLTVVVIVEGVEQDVWYEVFECEIQRSIR